MKLTYKAAAILSSVSLLATALAPMGFADNLATNDVTGPASTNESSITNRSVVTVSNINDASIKNVVKVVSNSGGNKVVDSTLGGQIVTNAATSSVLLDNTANINTTTVSGGPAASGNVVGNATTGPKSTNRASINNSSNITVYNDNTAVFDNDVDVVSDTGHNLIDQTTGMGMILSGPAMAGVLVTNRANDSGTSVSAGAGGTGGNMAGNDLTGPKSTNEAEIDNKALATISNINDAAMKNLVKARSNTGDNKVIDTNLGGSIVSGQAGTSVGLDSTGNINTTTVAMAMGGFSNVEGNSTTGPKSTNRTKILNQTNFTVYNSNNKCKSKDCKDYTGVIWGITNEDTEIADTGHNLIDQVTGMGDLVSGLATVEKTIRNWLNDTLTLVN